MERKLFNLVLALSIGLLIIIGIITIVVTKGKGFTIWKIILK